MPKAPVSQATIKRAVKAVQAAGLPVERVEVTIDGKVVVVTESDPVSPKAAANDWDKE